MMEEKKIFVVWLRMAIILDLFVTHEWKPQEKNNDGIVGNQQNKALHQWLYENIYFEIGKVSRAHNKKKYSQMKC